MTLMRLLANAKILDGMAYTNRYFEQHHEQTKREMYIKFGVH